MLAWVAAGLPLKACRSLAAAFHQRGEVEAVWNEVPAQFFLFLESKQDIQPADWRSQRCYTRSLSGIKQVTPDHDDAVRYKQQLPKPFKAALADHLFFLSSGFPAARRCHSCVQIKNGKICLLKTAVPHRM